MAAIDGRLVGQLTASVTQALPRPSRRAACLAAIYAVALLLGTAGGLLVAVQPSLALAAGAAVFIVGLASLQPARASSMFLTALAGLLLGYMLFGRAFAYIGAPPVYVGEAVLALGALLLPFQLGKEAWTGGARVVVVLLLAFMAWGAWNTFPYLGTYGLDSLRDAALWVYAAFSLLVAVAMRTSDRIDKLVWWFARLGPWFLAWSLLVGIATTVAYESIPRAPGTDIPILSPKPGDTAVHLAAIGALLLLQLHRADTRTAEGERRAGVSWAMWILWCAAVLAVAARGRGASLAIIASFTLVVLLRPTRQMVKPIILVVALLLVATTVGVRVGDEGQRPISSEQLSASLASISGSVDDVQLDPSRDWRLQWWRAILDYTLRGPFFWRGKGFGVNLADEDGFQVTVDKSLRSPHNVFLAILARSGIPGAGLWIALQVAFALSLLRVRWRARAAGDTERERTCLWLLAYWLAMLVNATFDVYLEGPQGGIAFWTVLGLGLAVVSQSARSPTAPQRPSSGSGPRAIDAVPRRLEV